MNPLAAITALAAGRPCPALLLPACRAAAYGVEAFGPTAIAALFARNQAPLSRTPDVIQSATGMALFDAGEDGHEQAWFADLFAGGIGRLWRIGAGPPEAAASVATDPFLSQQRIQLAFRAADHPDLAPEAIEPLRDAATDAAGTGRIAVLRAFSAADRTAALLARLGASPLLGGLALRHAAGAVVHRRITWG